MTGPTSCAFPSPRWQFHGADAAIKKQSRASTRHTLRRPGTPSYARRKNRYRNANGPDVQNPSAPLLYRDAPPAPRPDTKARMGYPGLAASPARETLHRASGVPGHAVPVAHSTRQLHSIAFRAGVGEAPQSSASAKAEAEVKERANGLRRAMCVAARSAVWRAPVVLGCHVSRAEPANPSSSSVTDAEGFLVPAEPVATDALRCQRPSRLLGVIPLAVQRQSPAEAHQRARLLRRTQRVRRAKLPVALEQESRPPSPYSPGLPPPRLPRG